MKRKLFVVMMIFTTGLFPSIVNSQPLAENLGRFLGAGTSSDIWKNFDLYWNQVTPGNDGKWGSVEAVQGTYNWTNLDKIYNYAVSRNILFKEHTFIWGSQQPNWINSLDSAGQRQAVENWIKSVGEKYPDMSFADVVNEPINAPPSYKNALGGVGATGWDWVITAFELARKYCSPGVKLILNEYNILQQDSTTNKYLEIINLLNDRGLIDGIGIQGHYFELKYYNSLTLKNNLKRLTDTGIPVYITEFDIDEPDDAIQLEKYKIYFPIFWNNPGVRGITFWGYIENDVWTSYPNTYLLHSDGRGRPALQWLRNYVLLPLIPEPISPVFTSNVQRNTIFIWHTSLRADSYQLQVSIDGSFSTIIVDTTLTDTTVQVAPLAANKRTYWRVKAINDTGQSEYSAISSFITGDTIVSVKEFEQIPENFALFQNYPNPFNPTTEISYRIAKFEHVQLKVYDLLGREVATLVNEQKSPGTYQVKFDGSKLTSGVYLYHLQAGNYSSSKKLILLK